MNIKFLLNKILFFTTAGCLNGCADQYLNHCKNRSSEFFYINQHIVFQCCMKLWLYVLAGEKEGIFPKCQEILF